MTDAEIDMLKALGINMPGADRDAVWLAAAERIRGICAERDEISDRLRVSEEQNEKLRAALIEACDHWLAWMTAEGRGPQSQRDRHAALAALADGGTP